jgi:type II secretory pathway pseudopilin PulG
MGMATAGLITGYLSLVTIFMIGLLAAIAIPNFVAARTKAQINACRVNLNTLQAAKERWALENPARKGTNPEDADIIGAGKYVTTAVCPAKGTYFLNAVNESPTCSVHGEIPNWTPR